jgi:acyl-CoA synthetase (AMP-forming)/AMP-acid ligase II
MAENVFAVTQTVLGRRVGQVEAEPEAFSRGRILAPRSDAGGIKILSCGPPVAGVELEIRDEGGNRVADGIVGEICIRSPFLFSGYYRLPKETAERLREGWYHTADMGFISGGELFVTGRKDDMIIVAGRNYYAHEIEALVNSVDAVVPGRNVAIGVEDSRTDATAIVVLAECASDGDLDAVARDVRREILEKLGLAIGAFVPLPTGRLVKTTSGKISRAKNKELYVAGSL